MDSAQLRAEHDRFYLYTNGGLGRDDIADVKLRAIVGIGLGYQVTETPQTNLSFEGGPSCVYKSF